MKKEAMVGHLIWILVLLFLTAKDVDSQRYTCWGGCYNECFLRSNKTSQSEKRSCYYQCLTTCIPRTPEDFSYYCQIGCSIQRCLQFTSDGAKMEKCFGNCTNQCNPQRN